MHTHSAVAHERTSASGGAARIVQDYAALEVAAHPLFVEMRAGPVDPAGLWLLMANLRAGISQQFVLWLASTILNVPDRRIASFVAKQLNDELGDGHIEKIHSVLLDRFVGALARYRLEGDDQLLLAPGRELARLAARPFAAAHPYEGVGALMVGEIFAEKMDHCVGEEVRRTDVFAREELEWLTVHECLEVDHAGDSMKLAAFVPEDGETIAAVQRGGREQWAALWAFLDQVHAVRGRCRRSTTGDA